MRPYVEDQLGYFIDYPLWEDALNLLNYQIEQKRVNKHFYTLSMFYYEKLGEWIRDEKLRRSHFGVKKAKSKAYFESKVSNGLFYGLTTEFAAYPYFEPKSRLGLRNYRFFTYPMRAVYYAIGLYILKLSQDHLSLVRKKQTIKSFYGGNLEYNQSLILNSGRVYYRRYYKMFLSEIENELKDELNNKICLRFDIANYFDSIDIFRLLDCLSADVRESIKRELKFDSFTIEQIRFYFNYINEGFSGILKSIME